MEFMGFIPPEPLNITSDDLATHFKKFKNQIKIYMVATETNSKSNDVQVARLKNLMGPNALDLYNTITNLTEDKETVDQILDILDGHCTPKKNMAMCVFKLLTRKQEAGELFDSFYADLQKLAKSCEFADQHDKMIKSIIILGIKSQQSQERLLREDPNLNKVVEICRAVEVADKNMAILNKNNMLLEVHDVRKNGQHKIDKHPDGNLTKSHGAISRNNVCSRCGYTHSVRHCPANNKRCAKCGGMNHFAKVCRNSNANRRSHAIEIVSEIDPHNVINNFSRINIDNNSSNPSRNNFVMDQGSYNREMRLDSILNNNSNPHSQFPLNSPSIPMIGETDRNEEFYIGCLTKIGSIGSGLRNEWNTTILLNNKPIKFKLDTGAEVNILPAHILETIAPDFQKRLRPTKIELESFGGFKIKPIGQITFNVRIEYTHKAISFVVVRAIKAIPILGLQACVDLELVTRKIDILGSVNNVEEFISANLDVFNGLGCFPEQLKLHLKEGAIPKSCPARRVPFKIMNRLKDKLDDLVRRGIIESCTAGEWVHNLVIVEKHRTGELRLCIDPQELNRNLIRDYIQIPTIDEISSRLSGKKYFCVFDLKDGFHQIKLDSSSSKLCTFSTPFGTFRYLRAPFGLSTLPEYFQKAVNNIFGGIDGVIVYFDDLLCAAESVEKLESIVKQLLTAARNNNVVLNRNKIQYFVTEVKFLGLSINQQGLKPDPEKIKAVQEIKSPSNRKELQRLLGSVNYLRSFIPNLSELTVSFKNLLSKSSLWLWTETHEKHLQLLKKSIACAALLSPYDVNKTIDIQADASQFALGAVLMQEGRPITYASRSLTSTEQNYAQIEKELLAITFAFSKFHNFVYGHKEVTVHSDHNPLTSIVVKDISKISNNRLRRLRIKLLPYTFTLKYLAGKYMHIADLLSRDCLPTSSAHDSTMYDIVHVITTVEELDPPLLKQYKEETLKDSTLQQIFNWYFTGWPKTPPVGNSELSHYFKLRSDITLSNNLVYFNDRIIVPINLRKLTLGLIHETHLGFEKVKGQAQKTFYWPGMVSDIKNFIDICTICNRFQRNRIKNPIMPHEIPKFPFLKIGMDIADHGGKSYLIIIDYYSRWIEIEQILNKSTNSIINVLRPIFARFGIPSQVIADNVPFASAEFKRFATAWNFQVVTSSPHYPRSNGLAEKGVGIAKSLLKKCLEDHGDIQMFLLNYRNSPVAGLPYSPSQLLQSRLLNSKLLFGGTNTLKPNVIHDPRITEKAGQVEMYNRNARIAEEKYNVGQSVFVRNVNLNIWEPGLIIQVLDHRSYVVNIGGVEYRRTSSFLRPRTVRLREGSNNTIKYDRSYDLDLDPSPLPTLTENQTTNFPAPVPITTRPSRIIRKPDRLNL